MWKVVDYKDKYFDQMVEMIRENYGDIEIAHEDFLKWQYFDNPAGKAVIKLAIDEDSKELAGQYIVIPYSIKVDKETVIFANSLDTLTRKAYRGQGIFKGLTKNNYIVCNDMDFKGVVIFPNKNSRPGFLKYFDFQSVCRFPILATPIQILHSKKSNESIIKITEDYMKLFDSFWEEIKHKYQIIGVRNAKYMKWRYLDIPLREYKFYGIVKNDQLEGYIIGVIKNISGIKTGVIVDFMVKSDCNSKDSKALINTILADFHKDKAKVSMAYVPKHSQEYKLLRDHCFFKWPVKLEPRLFEVLALDFKESSFLEDADGFQCEKWFTTIGDYLLV